MSVPPFQPAVDLGRLSVVTAAQQRAYTLTDRLRAAGFSVALTLADTVGQPSRAEVWPVPATRTVTMNAHRLGTEPSLRSVWVSVLAGARLSTHARRAEITHPGRLPRTLAAGDMVRWVDKLCAADRPDDEQMAGVRPLTGCCECGTTGLLHGDGCRMVRDALAEADDGGPPARVGYSAFLPGTGKRAALGVFPSLGDGVAWAEEWTRGAAGLAAEIRPVR